MIFRQVKTAGYFSDSDKIAGLFRCFLHVLFVIARVGLIQQIKVLTVMKEEKMLKALGIVVGVAVAIMIGVYGYLFLTAGWF